MYRVELIPKKSVMTDIIGYWTATGRPSNLDDGEFVFKSVNSAYINNGVITINDDADVYYYNVADFYRVKVISLGE